MATIFVFTVEQHQNIPITKTKEKKQEEMENGTFVKIWNRYSLCQIKIWASCDPNTSHTVHGMNPNVEFFFSFFSFLSITYIFWEVGVKSRALTDH